MSKGLLIVVSAPSGCGKGTILNQILKDEKYYYSVSATTREPREGEIDGVHYQFLSCEQFENLIAEHAFLEYASYCENYYGTLRKPIEENLANGRHVILEIEVNGAMQIRKLCPDAKFIFIAPPSLDAVKKRLEHRGTESA
ncbi:MAG: guanylate kinase, partial [Oscillospiraceae bacterium]|nr:guanylate kinase [Oscillospiraceae bacterium]